MTWGRYRLTGTAWGLRDKRLFRYLVVGCNLSNLTFDYGPYLDPILSNLTFDGGPHFLALRLKLGPGGEVGYYWATTVVF